MVGSLWPNPLLGWWNVPDCTGRNPAETAIDFVCLFDNVCVPLLGFE
jgi:hypothetical protein